MSKEKLKEKLISVFTDAQAGLHHHQNLCKTLVKIYESDNCEDEFLDVFVDLLKHAFVVFKREPAVDRLISFAGYFVSNCGEEFLLRFLKNTLAPFHAVQGKAVRFRVCQMTTKILEHMNDDVDLSDEIYRIIYKAVMVLAFDKVFQVRIQAILVLRRIQDFDDPDCPVVAAMLDRMQRDGSHEVRKCALQNIAGTRVSLPYIVERTRDVKDTVRKTAYSILARKFTIQNLSISQRLQVMKDGLNDNSAMVKDACASLLFSWLSSFDGDLIALVARLDVEGSAETTELSLMHLFKSISLDDLAVSMQEIMPSVDQPGDSDEHIEVANPRVIPYHLLTNEVAFFWLCLCKYYNSLDNKSEEYLSKVLPVPLEFTDYLKRYLYDYLFPAANDQEKMYECLLVVKQLISLTDLLDLSDEFGRQTLADFYCEILSLTKCSLELTSAIMDNIFCLWPQDSLCIEKLVGVISEIRQPMESVDPPALYDRELKIAGIKVALDEHRDHLGRAVTEQDFVTASNLKEKIAEQESILTMELDHTINTTVEANTSFLDPPEVLHKCLLIAHKLYSNLKMQKLGPALQTLLETLVLPCVQNEVPVVRNMAFCCLGSASLLDVDQAQKYLHLLLRVSQIDHEMIQATALKMVFDVLLLYGTELFGNDGMVNEVDDGAQETDNIPDFPDEAGDKKQDVDQATQCLLKILAEFLDHESFAMREISAEGLAKLLYCGRVLSQRILGKLILLWFNPVMEGSAILRNLLGTFFPVFAAADKSNRECLCEVFVPVISTVMEAPGTSPLIAGDVNNMADFLLTITTPKSSSEDGHNTLAIAVCHKILSCCSAGDHIDVYCRALSRMCLAKDQQSDLQSLHLLLDQLKAVVSGRQNLKYIEKLSAGLCKLCPAAKANSDLPRSPSSPATGGCTSCRTVNKENISTTTSVRPKRTVKKSILQVNTSTTQNSKTPVTDVLSNNHSGTEESDEGVTIKTKQKRTTRGNIKAKLNYDDDDGNLSSDDSYLETGSPFVGHTKSRTTSNKQILSSEDDDT